MSKKRLINLIQIIIQALILISMISIKTVELVGYSSTSNSFTENIITTSILGYSMISGNFLGYIALILLAIGIVTCFVSVVGNSTDRDGKSHIFLSIAILFFCFWISSVSIAPYGYSSLSVNSFYKTLVIIVLVINLILSIVKRTSLVVPKVEISAQNISIVKSDADELKKFKELVDSGIITEEEYEAKKKQLLGL